MRILVCDGDTRSALAAVRSLGRRGHEVYTAGAQLPCLSGRSRYSTASDRYPDPIRDAMGFVNAVVEIVQRRNIEVLIPTTEVSTLLITEHQALLPKTCALPFASAATVARASNKVEVMQLARELGVPVPQSIVLDSAADAQLHLPTLQWPLVVKPGRSRVHTPTRWISTSVRYASDAAQLDSILAALPAEAFPVMLQERIQGPGVGAFVCMDGAGVPVALFAHRRLREKPPSGGVSVLSESAPLDAKARDHALKLLRALGWRGVAMVEFKQDQRDGSLRLMEINARFWGSLQLAITAGVDFPAILAQLAAGERLGPPPEYRVGVRSRWLAGDLDALLMRLRRSRKRLDLNASHPGRLRALWDFLHFFGKDLNYEIEQADDPAPARLEWKRWLLGS